MSEISLNFINETEVSVKEGDVLETLKLVLRRLNHTDKVNIELLLVGDTKIKQLNNKYRSKSEPTDVLSFPSSNEHGPKEEFTGSIVISVDTAKKQAKSAGIELIEEIKTLSGHGLLHLLGFHHN